MEILYECITGCVLYYLSARTKGSFLGYDQNAKLTIWCKLDV